MRKMDSKIFDSHLTGASKHQTQLRFVFSYGWCFEGGGTKKGVLMSTPLGFE